MNELPELISEVDFGRRFGISRTTLRDLRAKHLEEGVDFEKNGGPVVLTKNGREKIAGLIRTADRAGEPVAVQDAIVERILIVAVVPKNPRVVLAVAPGTTEPRLTVRVASNVNYALGMEITARPADDGSACYWVTSKAPKFRGQRVVFPREVLK